MMIVDTWDLKACGRLKAASYCLEDYFSMQPMAPWGSSLLPNVPWQEEKREEPHRKE